MTYLSQIQADVLSIQLSFLKESSKILIYEKMPPNWVLSNVVFRFYFRSALNTN